MNSYKFTFRYPESSEETAYITERTEAAARKALVKRFGKDAEVLDVELHDTGVPATKEQERETLEKIKSMVADLGPQSYLAAAFQGVFEDAEQNIEDDAAVKSYRAAKERREVCEQIIAGLEPLTE